MSTFILPLDPPAGDGPRLAVKDLIDMEGLPTTAGCKAVADTATSAGADAPCLAGARAAGARIVGKVNLHELAFGATGINPWFGTPINPLGPDLVPGGSSSGSAVAVANDDADVALGSDTGGSVRIPSACCGTTGLKTTHGRISIEGVWPLAQSLDTIGPMARDVAGCLLGMQLLEPGFAPAGDVSVVGRVRVEGVDPAIDAAIDQALASWGVEVVDVPLPGWDVATQACYSIIAAEAWANDEHLDPAGIGPGVHYLLQVGAGLDEAAVADAERQRQPWRDELAAAFGRVQLLALPTIPVDPPRIDAQDQHSRLTELTAAINLGGNPALSLPVPRPAALPASLQLVAPLGGEELLLSVGPTVEAAIDAEAATGG